MEAPNYYKIVIVEQGHKNYLFGCPTGVNLHEGDKVICDTKRGDTEGVCVTDSFVVNEYVMHQFGKILGAKFPLKLVIGKYIIESF